MYSNHSVLHLKKLLIEVVIPAFCIALFFVIVFNPIFSTKFDLSDDHEIIRFSSIGQIHPLLINRDDFVGPVSRTFITFDREIAQGRFRPFYYITRFFEIDILGRDPHAWHIYKWMIGVWTALLFYMAIRLAHIPRWIGGGAVLFLTLQGNATEIWYRIGPAETQGIFLTAIALYAIVYGARRLYFSWADVIAIIVLALAGWTKESFILIAPSLMGIRILLSVLWHPDVGIFKIFRHVLPLCITSGIIFSVQLIFVFLKVRTNYVSLTTNAYSPLNWLDLFWSMANYHTYFILAGIGIMLTLIGWFRNRSHPKYIWIYLGAGAIIALWLIPQFILHSTGFYNSRYIYPVIIGMIMINMLFLMSASLYFPRLTPILAVPVIVLFSINNAFQTHNSAYIFMARTQILSEMISFVADRAKQRSEEYIIIETHPVERYEQTISLVVFLGSAGVNNRIVLHLSAGNGSGHPSGLDLNARLPNYGEANNLSVGEGYLIITLLSDHTFQSNVPVWFDNADYTRHEFSRSYELWNEFSLTRRLDSQSITVYERND